MHIRQQAPKAALLFVSLLVVMLSTLGIATSASAQQPPPTDQTLVYPAVTDPTLDDFKKMIDVLKTPPEGATITGYQVDVGYRSVVPLVAYHKYVLIQRKDSKGGELNVGLRSGAKK